MSTGVVEPKKEEQVGSVEPLTERELAILQDKDPDAIGEETVTDDEPPVIAGRIGPPDGAGQEASQPEGDTDVTQPPVDKPPDWITTDHKALADSYGLSDADMAGFDNPEEFRRAMVLFDKQLVTGKPGQISPVQQQQHQQVQQQVSPGQTPPTKPVVPAKIDPKLFEEQGYTPETVEMAKVARHLQDQQEVLLAELQELKQFRQGAEQEFSRAQLQTRLEAFHDAMDQMDEKRFGRAWNKNGDVVSLSKTADENRRQVWQMSNQIAKNLAEQAQKAGKEPPPMPFNVLLQRAYQAVFTEDILKEERRKFQEKVSKQSRQRRPAAGVSRASTPSKAGSKPALDLAKDPDIIKFFEQTREENGE